MRLIDANELKMAWDGIDGKMHTPVAIIRALIDDAPTIDAVPVVRCKECKHYWKNHTDDCSVHVCLASPKDDAFCSEGERKDDEE